MKRTVNNSTVDSVIESLRLHEFGLSMWRIVGHCNVTEIKVNILFQYFCNGIRFRLSIFIFNLCIYNVIFAR